MKPRELCEKAWQEIAQYFPDFKSMQKGQKLKKISKNKDLTFEIYFKPSRRNYAYSVEFSVYICIHSTAMKKADINNGIAFDGELESIIDRGRNYRWLQFAGASYPLSIHEIVELIQEHILPIFEDFEEFKSHFEKILIKGCKNFSLFYYVYFFGGKEKAEQYLHQFIEQSPLKNKYKGFYRSLINLPKENIDIHLSEFIGADIIKFAYLNGIELKD